MGAPSGRTHFGRRGRDDDGGRSGDPFLPQSISLPLPSGLPSDSASSGSSSLLLGKGKQRAWQSAQPAIHRDSNNDTRAVPAKGSAGGGSVSAPRHGGESPSTEVMNNDRLDANSPARHDIQTDCDTNTRWFGAIPLHRSSWWKGQGGAIANSAPTHTVARRTKSQTRNHPHCFSRALANSVDRIHFRPPLVQRLSTPPAPPTPRGQSRQPSRIRGAIPSPSLSSSSPPLDTVMEEHDPFDEISRAEELALAAAAVGGVVVDTAASFLVGCSCLKGAASKLADPG